MFDIELAIRGWKADLNRGGAVTHESLDELESHLRDSMEELQDSGLTVSEAFAVSISRMGTSPAIRQEFAKTNRTPLATSLLFWLPWIYLLWLVCASMTEAFLKITELSTTAFQNVSLAIAFLCWILVLISLSWQITRDYSRFGRVTASMRHVTIVVGMILIGQVSTLVGNILQAAYLLEDGKTLILNSMRELPNGAFVVTMCVALIYLIEDSRNRYPEITANQTIGMESFEPE